MKLDLLVPHYKEDWSVCKNLFDSLATQRGINFDDVRIILVNDGNEVILDDSNFKKYPFKTVYLVNEHKGVSAARNFALDSSDADYVMFADIDDMFLNNYGLHMVFSSMSEGFETLHSCFIEEQPEDNGGWKILRHDKDITFVHGKVHNRQFLIDNNLRFDESLTIHEDGHFNYMVHTVADNVKYITTPFYLWVYNEESTVRKDKEDYIYKTYKELMEVRTAIAHDLLERGFVNEYIDSVVHTVANSYYDFCLPAAINKKTSVMIKNAEKEFKKYFTEFGKEYYEANPTRIAEFLMIGRTNAYAKGLLTEDKTLKDWLTHIKNI